MLCCMPSILPENPSPQATKIFNVIRVLSVIQFSMGIFALFIDFSSGFYVLIGSFLLYFIVCGRNFCTCICYCIFTLLDLMGSISLIAFYFSSHSFIPNSLISVLSVHTLKVPFYTVSIFYAFLAYRELKALSVEFEVSDSLHQSDSAPQPRQINLIPYSGPGYIIM